MVKYLSFFFIFILILTGFILSFNPSMHKSVSIGDSKSNIALETKDNISINDEKIKNQDNIKSQGTKFKNIDNLSSADIKFNNQDNITGVGAGISPSDNTYADIGFGLSNQDNISQVPAQSYTPQNYQKPSQSNYEYDYDDLYDEFRTPSQEPEPQQVAQQPPVYNQPQTSSAQRNQTSDNEVISWNIWRSNLGNYIADDFEKWATVNGTYIFYFSVDNQRKISNPVILVVGMASNEARMAAYRYLYSLSGSQILEFPSGSNRKIVNAMYSIYIDDNTEDSSLHSSDFSDYEKIR